MRMTAFNSRSLCGCAGAAVQEGTVGDVTGVASLHGQQHHDLSADLLDGLAELYQPLLMGMVCSAKILCHVSIYTMVQQTLQAVFPFIFAQTGATHC